MNEILYKDMAANLAALKTGVSMNELSGLAVDHNYGEKELEAVNTVFSYILSRKRERSFETLLSLSRLPKRFLGLSIILTFL